jgi:hypothetical protein
MIAEFSSATSPSALGSIGQTTQRDMNMAKKLTFTALVVLAFGFGTAPLLKAGTEVIEPYRAPAPAYNYAPPLPPPRPVVFVAPRPVVGVVVAPAFGYYGRGYGSYGGHRYYGRRAHWRDHHHWH